MAYGLTKSALLVSATPSYLETASNPTNLNITDNITIEAWIKINSLPSDRAEIVCKPNNTADGYGTYSFEIEKSGANYNLRLVVSNGGGTPRAAISLSSWNPSTGVWYHVAVTRASGTGACEIIINGTSAATNTDTTGSTLSTTSKVFIGQFSGTTSLPFDGYVSLVRIWNNVRSAATIAANICNVFGTATTNLQAEWSLNNVLTDASGNGYTLTNTNSVTFQSTVPAVCSPVSTSNFFPLFN